jgi:8-oxo-dGTP pyrophosphatase MutT (NUDIX family)
MSNRSKLPFRVTAKCFLLYKGKLIAKDMKNKEGKYVLFPGGGVDEGESIKKGALRELMEEIGAIVEDFKEVGIVKYLWWYELMHDHSKRIERWNKYQGEEVHFFIGKIKEFIVLYSSAILLSCWALFYLL